MHLPFARSTKQKTGNGFLDVHAAKDRGRHTLRHRLVDVGWGSKATEFLFITGCNGSLGWATCTFCIDLDPNHSEIWLSDAHVDPLTRIFLPMEQKKRISSNGISFFCLSQCIQQSILHCVKTLHNKTNPTKNVETSECYIHKSNHLFKQENAWLSHFFSTHICQTIIRHGSHKIKDSVRQRISLIINFSSFIS